MPAAAGALGALGKGAPTVYSNSAVLAHPALEPLTDIFALPRWVPFANVFSVGDILLGAGVALIIVVAMRRPAQPTRPRRPSRPRPPLRPSRSRLPSRVARQTARPPMLRIGRRCAGAHRTSDGATGTSGRWDPYRDVRTVHVEDERPPLEVRPGQTRREAGRKARIFRSKTARPPVPRVNCLQPGVLPVKSILARFTWVLALVASMALTLGAGMRWWD